MTLTDVFFDPCGVRNFMGDFLKPLCSCFRGWNMTGDFLYNACRMYKTQGIVQRWKIDRTEGRIYRKLHAQIP